MPELAEVEAYRRVWECGHGDIIKRVALHPDVRVFRSTDARAIHSLAGSKLVGSEARGKLMMFRFSRDRWLTVHLGMSGHLRVEAASFSPGRHDHLVLYQQKRALVFTDPRQFGAVRFQTGKEAPAWWLALPPSVLSDQFTIATMIDFLRRHPRLPIKGTLLLQTGFPGIGNWMADEILWQARMNPRRLTGRLDSKRVQQLWRKTRVVCRLAVQSIVERGAEPPKKWLFHQRWSGDGKCPRHGTPLKRATVAGRTTAWCPRCQA